MEIPNQPWCGKSFPKKLIVSDSKTERDPKIHQEKYKVVRFIQG